MTANSAHGGESNVLTGSCHCGNVSVSLSTSREPGTLNPRACDCSFCTKHAAMYVSDPVGRLRIEVQDPDRLARYRQGSETADFLFCGGCGILVAVTSDSNGKLLGAVNARCLAGLQRLGEPMVVSPQKLGRDEKTARWATIWTQDVEITVAKPASRSSKT